jgi:Holliday junction resolvase RusA-like endonuclease
MIYFKVDGAAVPKQRPRISGHRAYTPKRTKDYEERVLNEFRSSYSGFYPAFGKDTPVRICISVIQEIPKSWSKKKRAQAESGEIVPLSRNGDVDNIAKSILDALNGFAYEDDCQVTTLMITKQYGAKPCAEVRLGEDE